MIISGKFLKVASLVLLQIVLVGNLQALPANAVYGSALPFLYMVGVIGFFIPTALMTAELATKYPQTGGAYIWSERAFGPSTGFFTICVLWVSNLLWYPSIFALIAANVAYLFNDALAQNRSFVFGFSLLAFWSFTGLNCLGVKFSTRLSIIFGVIGVILPLVIIIAGGTFWWLSGQPVNIIVDAGSFLPSLGDFNNPAFLIAIAVSLFGLEMVGVHAGDVVNPKRDFPRSLFLGATALVGLLLLSELAVAAIVPTQHLSLVTGLFDAIKYFFHSIHMPYLIKPLLFLVFIGNIGSVAAWMMGSTRGMFVGCKRNGLADFLIKTNRYQAPVGILIFEAVIFTLASSVFLIITQVSDSFWLLLDLSSQVSLVYYIILFASAIRLRNKPADADGYTMPGGKFGLWLAMGLGVLTSIIAFTAGFISPFSNSNAEQNFFFHFAMWVGLMIALFLPLALLLTKKELSQERL